jgi:hypothetical protein
MGPGLNKRFPAASEEIANLLRIWRNRPRLPASEGAAIGIRDANPAH